jgi:arginyl-tRNA synthetase
VLHLPIEKRLRETVAATLPDLAPADLASVQVKPCPDPKFGDYQCNALMSLAKSLKKNPRQLASDVLANLDVSEWCETPELAGAGFINFRLKPFALVQALRGAMEQEHPFVAPVEKPRTIVVDFSSPNVAKPMHVGHIRSTVLGDALARILRLLGHRVITDNHIGDWGTQFGMLIVGWNESLNREALKADPIAEMERIYRQVNADCTSNPEKREAARLELVKLQQGDAVNLEIWRDMIRLSQAQFDRIYSQLGVKFDHTLGESFYNSRLQSIVDELIAKGIARESEGAKAVFSDGRSSPKEDPFLIQRDGEWQPNPQLIQKSDGGFNYATTDLATLAHRLETWRPDEIIYVTDGRQQLHFRQLFATFGRWHPELAGRLTLAHVWFGSILGEDGKPFKTRSGDTVRLAELLDEAEHRAFDLVTSKNPESDEKQRREIARVVGLGSVKYADLLPNRQSDYTFSWDKMLALNGNTAPYLQYAYARIRSIFRKGNVENAERGTRNAELLLTASEEIALAKHLLNFGLVLEAVAEEYRPNYLCTYLYDLAGHFARFYENCPVLKASGVERTSRLVLCDLTARVLAQGLGVLGIETLEQM